MDAYDSMSNQFELIIREALLGFAEGAGDLAPVLVRRIGLETIEQAIDDAIDDAIERVREDA